MSASEADVTGPAVDTAEEGEDAATEESASALKRRRGGKLGQLTQLIKRSGAALEAGLGIEALKDLHRRISGQLNCLKALDQECTEQCEVEGVPPPSSMRAKETSAVAMMEGIAAFIAEQEQLAARNTDAVSVVSRAPSNRSRRSGASNASRAAAQELEVANLRLTQQRAREASERLREEQEQEEEEARRRRERDEGEARRRKRERERQRERELLEQETEVAALRERLARAAEDDLAWERRADFDGTQRCSCGQQREGRLASRSRGTACWVCCRRHPSVSAVWHHCLARNRRFPAGK